MGGAKGSNVIVDDGVNRLQLYRRWQPDPGAACGVLATLDMALPYALPLPRFEAADFIAALVRAWAGFGACFEGRVHGFARVNLEAPWVYVVHARTKDGRIAPRDGAPAVQVVDAFAHDFKALRAGALDAVHTWTVPLSRAKQAGLAW